MKYRDKDKTPKRLQNFHRFLRNFYSGMVYNGIEELDIDITFTNEDGTKVLEFPKFVSEENHELHVWLQMVIRTINMNGLVPAELTKNYLQIHR